MNPGRSIPWRSLVFLCLLLQTDSGSAGSLESQVLDAQTGKPIQGAVVLGVWTKVAGLPGLQHHELVGVREVETDAEGRFVLERAKRIIFEDDESVTVYKPGYVAWNNIYIFPTSERRKDQRIPSQIFLIRFPPGESHKRHTSFIDGARRGGYGIETIPKFWNAYRQELQMP